MASDDAFVTITLGLISLVSGILMVLFPEFSVRWMTWGFVDGSNWKESARFFGWLSVLAGLCWIATGGWFLINHR